MEYFILDEHGNELAVDVHTWALWFENQTDRRRIALTEVREGIDVSTVFIGFNHGREGERLLYETMIFGGPLDGECRRAATRQQAEENHAAAVSRLQNLKW